MASIGSTSSSRSVARAPEITSGERRHMKAGLPAQSSVILDPTATSVRSKILVDWLMTSTEGFMELISGQTAAALATTPVAAAA